MERNAPPLERKNAKSQNLVYIGSPACTLEIRSSSIIFSMARIREPKPLNELIQDVTPEELVPLMRKYRATDAQGRYFHWHEFQWRVEKGDDKLKAWTATKFARISITKKLPLQAEDDRCFSYCVPDSLFARLHRIDKMTGGGREIDEGTLVSSREKDRYLVKSLMQEEAITSSQLEGASTTRKVAKEMLEKNLPPKDKSQQMILNNYRLMKKAVENKNRELSIDFILELHEIAIYKAIENQAEPGEIRKNNDIVVTDLYNNNRFEPPDWESIPSRLIELCDFANLEHNDPSNFIHPIIKAIILHFMIAYIHPFADGNGRTARAIFYWSILRSGYWLFEYVSISKFIQESRGDYDKAFIYTETDDFDITYFLYNQVDVVEKAVKSLQDYIDRKKREFYDFTDWLAKSPVAKTLIQGQIEIVKEALKTPGREFTVKQVSSDLEVAENTARSYLNTLVDKQLLVREKSSRGKAIAYLSPANLKERLQLR
ncbi:Fic family protein [Pannus brasiliensis CCIBt3594]|uniref:Fic family protein n=1 Tax=Pannus brasiliensis CCIBt3594 TaxID=1427578 RepID=A0AAW9QMB6_9CHRO